MAAVSIPAFPTMFISIVIRTGVSVMIPMTALTVVSVSFRVSFAFAFFTVALTLLVSFTFLGTERCRSFRPLAAVSCCVIRYSYQQV